MTFAMGVIALVVLWLILSLLLAALYSEGRRRVKAREREGAGRDARRDSPGL